ncbi:MAG TPA: SDR family oxidoreductase [Actinocrinis sp.]|jgi:NAD(P)-dependent dehydrogenase (short-subunit alcohol dehydrogenase family)
MSDPHEPHDPRYINARPLPSGARLGGRVVVVTGSGGTGDGIGIGIGRAVAVVAALEGACVVLVDREPAGAHRTVAIAGELGADDIEGRSLVVAADVTSAEDTARVAGLAAGHFGRIDALVNNVGIIGPAGTAVDVDPDAWRAAFEVNVTSMMLMSKACVPHIAVQGGGAIVNVSSTAGMRGGHPNLFYPTSKAAVVNMTRAMAAHHGRAGVRVNAVAPGLVETPMVGADRMSERRRGERRESSLLGTTGTAWDVAKAVAFLLCDDARWITGVLLPVDAGLTAAAKRPPLDPEQEPDH